MGIKLKQEVLNKIVAKVAQKQNEHNKLNAGEIREFVTKTLESIVEMSMEGEATMDFRGFEDDNHDGDDNETV